MEMYTVEGCLVLVTLCANHDILLIKINFDISSPLQGGEILNI